MDTSLPRLLFFTSEIPQSKNAGSMQLYRTLQGYPGDHLRIVGLPIEPGATGLPCEYRTRKLPLHRLVNTRFRRWVTGLNSLDLIPEPGLRKTAEHVEDFQPDLVLTVMDHLSYYKHACRLAQRLGAGFVSITMDDPQVFETAHPLFQRSYDRTVANIYRSTALSLGVSHEMCSYLERTFGRASVPFYFGPPDGIAPRPLAETKTLRQPPHLTLGYAGSLGLGYDQGLRALLPALEATGTHLRVYSHFPNIILHPNITNCGYLPIEKLWPTVQRECDAVLLPYAPSGEILRIYRTHFPTKLSEYCAIAMPMLLIGPAEATGIRWGLRHPAAALVATDYSPASVVPLLNRLRDDPKLRTSLSDAGRQVAENEFHPAAARARFRELMGQARDAHLARSALN